MLSITQNNICLPARALRTINKIRQCTKATVPHLPPHVSFSFSSLCSLPFCYSSFASTMQTFSGLSSPLLLRERAHKLLLMRSWQHACLPRHKRTHTQPCKLTQKLMRSCWRQTWPYPVHAYAEHTCTQCCCLQPACCCAESILHSDKWTKKWMWGYINTSVPINAQIMPVCTHRCKIPIYLTSEYSCGWTA